jgi:uncharacterized protein (DUF433 family)
LRDVIHKSRALQRKGEFRSTADRCRREPVIVPAPDRRDLPAYSPAEAAHYLGIPLSTIRYWAAGRTGGSHGLIQPAQRLPLGLSFRNRVELLVLGAIRLFPFTRNVIDDAPRLIVIDPDLGFGRPVIAGTGLVTEEIAARYKAGESVSELARDYGRPIEGIDEAVRCELQAA